jgi:hypothetical protein
MKFLRKFNESLDFDPEVLAWTEENLDMIPIDDKQYKMAKAEYDTAMLKDYCEMNLAYLIDEGFFIDVHSHSVGYYSITLRRSLTTNQHGVHTSYFRWDDIKDHYIPFIQRIKNTYKLSSDYINFTSSNSMDLISFPFYKLDDINVYWDISRITFKIEENSL